MVGSRKLERIACHIRSSRRFLPLISLVVAGVALVIVSSVAAATSARSAPAAAEPITLVKWDWGQPDAKFIDKVNAQYTKLHPNVTIKHVVQPFASYFTLLRASVASKSGPDIIENYATAAIFDYTNGLLPLTSYVTPAQRADLVGWGNVSAGLNPSKTPYGVPFGAQGNVWYYNKALFKKAGLDPNAPPKTWAQFLAACQKLKDAGIVPISAGFKDGYYAEWWFDNVAPQYMTQKALDAFPGKPQWTNPAIVKSFEVLLDVIKQGYTTPNSEGIPLFPDVANDFGAGKGAMFLGLAAGTAHWGDFRKTLGKNLGTFLPPLMPGSKWSQQKQDLGPQHALSIAKWSKHPKEAYDYISFLTNAANQAKATREIGFLPNNNKIVLKPVGYAPADKILGWVKRSPKFTGPDFTIRPSVEAVMDKVVPSIVVGQQSIADALKQVQQAQDKLPPIPQK